MDLGRRTVADAGAVDAAGDRDADRGNRRLAVPGMVLLGATAIFVGYYWLQLIPDGSLHPSGLLAAVAAVPVTLGLTRHDRPGRAAALRWLARVSAGTMPALALVGLVTHSTGWTRALGAVSLVLAASLLALAVLSERADQPRV